MIGRSTDLTQTMGFFGVKALGAWTAVFHSVTAVFRLRSESLAAPSII
jgi:hypothetical protein